MNTKMVGVAGLALLVSGVSSVPALAAGAGEVSRLSGTLSVQRPDGSVRALGQKSEVQPGDVLTTQRDSYAQINFSDGSSMTMRPETQMKVETYQFVPDRPQEDSAFFRLIKGGLRTVTGLVGKRGNQDAYKIGTTIATIGIRGSGGETRVGGGGGVDHYSFLDTWNMCNKAGCQDITQGFSGRADNETDPIKTVQGPFDQELLKRLRIDGPPQLGRSCGS